MEYASRNDQAIVTENVNDFSVLVNTWATRGASHAGTVFTNPSRLNRASLSYPDSLIKALDTLLGEATDPGSSWILWL